MKNFTVNTITWHKQTPKNMQTYYDVRSFFSLSLLRKSAVCRCLLMRHNAEELFFAFFWILIYFTLFFSWWNTDTEKRKWAKEISGLFGNLKLCEKKLCMVSISIWVCIAACSVVAFDVIERNKERIFHSRYLVWLLLHKKRAECDDMTFPSGHNGDYYQVIRWLIVCNLSWR